jgi:hypothetical protein
MSPRIHRFAFCLGIVAVLLIASTANAQLKFRKIGSVQPASNEAESDTSADKSKQTISSKNPKLAPTKLTVTNVSSGSGVLPREHNQKWREYDIRPYTSRVTTTERPEQAVIDWVLRETGTEVWFTEPFGILNASKDTLRVYHTDEMHAVVRDIVDRVVSSQAESYAFGIRLLTVGNPNWRAKALPLMQSVTVQSPGVDAWLLSKENATILLSELRKRTDFREHNSPNLMIHNGQSQTISAMRPRSYTRSVRLRQNAFPAYELEMGQIQEGYSLQISPLLSLDERNVEVVLKCQIDQVEKLIPVSIDVPTASPTRQKAQVQVPQMVSWRLHERFRWPTDQVLLLSCGVVATPTDERSTLSLPKLFTGDRGRADALLLIESNGKASQVLLGSQRTADRSSPNYRGRY